MKYTAWTSFEFFGSDLEVKFTFDYYEGAPEYKTWNGWQPAEEPSCEVLEVWLITTPFPRLSRHDPQMVKLHDKFQDALQADCNEGGDAWDAVLVAVHDGP